MGGLFARLGPLGSKIIGFGGRLLGGFGKAAGATARVVGKGALVVGGGLLSGLRSGLFGGKLGDSGTSGVSSGGSQQQSSYLEGISSIFAPTSTSTKVSGPLTKKDNCCCCDQTISLLSSIDETLKRSLYVSQAMNLAAKETAAERGDKKVEVAGLGGRMEAMKDSAEKAGFGLGSMIASVIGLSLISNLGPVLNLLKGIGSGDQQGSGDQATNQNSDQQKGFFQDPNLFGTIGGGLLGAALGGKQKIAGAAVGAVLGSDVTQGVYQAKSEEGEVAGLAGSILGGIGVGAAGGALFGPVGAVVGGILGGIFGEDLFEGLGDVFAGKFNEKTKEAGKDIGQKAGEELNKSFRPTISSVGPASNAGMLPANVSGQEFVQLSKAVMKAESGGNPNAISPKGAIGSMQIMPDTLRDPGYGITPARDNSNAENIRVGNEYLSAMLKEFKGNTAHALAAYNWGPGNTKKWVARGAKFEELPKETQDYIQRVTRFYNRSTQTGADALVAGTEKLKKDSEEMIRMAEATAGGEFYTPFVSKQPSLTATAQQPKIYSEKMLKGAEYAAGGEFYTPFVGRQPSLTATAQQPKRNPEEMTPAITGLAQRNQSSVGGSSPQIVINNSGAAPQAVRQIASIPSIVAPRILPPHITQFNQYNTGMQYA